MEKDIENKNTTDETMPVNEKYEKLYAAEIKTLRVAFEVLDEETRKEYNKRVYEMIDGLIEKGIIDKLH